MPRLRGNPMAVQTPIKGTSTPAQRRAIVLAGRRHGLDVDDLRGLTTRGSLRALSFEEASDLLDRLNNGRARRTEPARRPRSRRADPGVVRIITERQRAVIASYRDRLEWSDEHLDGFLKRTFGLTMRTLARRHDASRVITVLRRVVDDKAGKGPAFELPAIEA